MLIKFFKKRKKISKNIAGRSCNGIGVSLDELCLIVICYLQIIILSCSFKEQVLEDQTGFQGLTKKKKKKDFTASEMLVLLKHGLTKNS